MYTDRYNEIPQKGYCVIYICSNAVRFYVHMICLSTKPRRSILLQKVGFVILEKGIEQYQV